MEMYIDIYDSNHGSKLLLNFFLFISFLVGYIVNVTKSDPPVVFFSHGRWLVKSFSLL